MAVLPDSYLDTGITATHTLAFSLQFRAQAHNSPGTAYFDFDGLSAFGVTVFTTLGSPALGNPDLGADWDSALTVNVTLNQSGVLSTLVSGAGSGAGDPGFLAAVQCQRATTNVRLGVRLSADNVLEYAWFWDSASTTTWTIGGTVVRTLTHPEPPENLGPGGQLLTFSAVGVVAGNPVFPMSRAQTFLSQGAAMTGVGPLLDPTTYFVGLTWNWTAAIRTVDEAGSDAYAADALYRSAVHTTPATPTYSVVQDWGTAPPAARAQLAGHPELTDPWLSAQAVAPDVVDRPYVIEGQAPENPAAAFTSWNVGTLTLAANRDVLLSATAWTGTNATISADTPPLNIVVAATPASVSRTLAESWRDWNDPLDADFEADDDFTTTAHDFYASGAGDDVWGWNGYAFLDLTFTAAPAATLTLAVDWVAIREDESLLTVTREYSFAVNGAATHRIDLLLPDDGDVPFFGERVDAIRLSGMAVGTYTLTLVRLVADQDAYLKVGSRQIAEPLGAMIAQDGQFVFSQWDGDTSREVDDDGDEMIDTTKDQQNGVFRVAVDETAEVAMEHLGGAAAMVLGRTLQEWFTELSRLERASTSYSSGTIQAALQDGFGTQILSPSTYPSYWILPNLPHARVAPGGTATIAARLVVADLSLPAGIAAGSVVVHFRNRLGCALEAQGVTASRTRAADGQTVTARAHRGAPQSGDVSLGTGTTEDGGFVTVPIRTGTLKISAGVYEAFWAYLT